MTIVLGSVGEWLSARAEPDGWYLAASDQSADLSVRSSWPKAVLSSAEGMTAMHQAEMLVEMGLADVRGHELVIPWANFGDVLRLDVGLPTRWTEWSPFLCAISSSSEIGRPDFRYSYEYRTGSREVPVDRCGYFVRHRVTGKVFHLDPDAYALVDAIDRFNDASDEERKANGWATLASVKGAALPIGAALDEYLEFNDVLVPSELALDVYRHEDDSVSFVPKCPDVDAAEFRKAFLRQSGVPDVYSIDGEDGRRVRLVIGARHREVLSRMKGVARVRGAERDAALRQPEKFFDGLLDAITIEYGPRVIGIGEYEFKSTPHDPRESGGFFEREPPAGEVDNTPRPVVREFGPEVREEPTQIEVPGPEGEGAVTLCFRDKASVDAAANAMAEALSAGEKTVSIGGREVEVSQQAKDALTRAPEAKQVSKAGRKFLLVYTNEDAVLQADAAAAQAAASAPGVPLLAVPRSISPDITLMPHQVAGLAWMLQCDAKRPERTGILLADDMGLGKTLQVLTYLASLIESGRVPAESAPDGTFRYRPMLIVAPLILIENGTWEKEIRGAFVGEGSAFDPILVLHGRNIDHVRAKGRAGQETVVGQPVLDIEKLMTYRTVITTYETAVSYQHSLAQMKGGKPLWSVLVTDEAQRYKAPDTKVSHAIKAIASAAAFRIASTGTPVENRLLDLWNIVDSSVQTALLGDRQSFAAEFERPAARGEAEDALRRLRAKLLFGEPHSFVLRRSKDEVLDLPKKTEIKLRAEMSSEESATHRALVGSLDTEQRRGRHLAVLHQLAQLYQHPALLRGNPSSIATDELLAQSGKLRSVVEKLREISAAGEKVIVFARLLAMQQILCRVFEREFGIRVPVINGTPSRDSGYDGSSSATGRAHRARRSILEEFEKRPGFGVLILSPHVAGIGLTITAANHVIHYGRWWNPAVEAQATDRAYRIGQQRPVSVYLPILTYAQGGTGSTFDERLDALMERKTALRRDFLQPDAPEEDNANELCLGLHEELEGTSGISADQPVTAAVLKDMSPHLFEAAVGALLSEEGFSIVLTTRAGDGGADVIARNRGDLVLIQAKHSRSDTPMDATAVGDVVGALDVYGKELRRNCRAMVVTNASISQPAVQVARDQGVELLSGERLVERFRRSEISISHVVAVEAKRCSSFADGVAQARLLISE